MWRPTLTMSHIEGCSLVLLLVGVVLTLSNFSNSTRYLVVNLVIYVLSFGILYLSKRFRQFIIYPTTTARPSKTTYSVYPWIPEGEVRWPAQLERITITLSNSLKLRELSFGTICLIEDGNPVKYEDQDNPPIRVEKITHHTTTTYSISFNPPEKIEINAVIRFTLEQNDDVELDPFLEYAIEYKPPKLPFKFKYCKRIF